MNTFYCISSDSNKLSEDGIGILLFMARWLMNYRQEQLTLVKEKEGFEVVLSTKFIVRQIDLVTGYEFNAVIKEDGKNTHVSFIVQQVKPIPRVVANKLWVENALAKSMLTSTAARN